MNKIGTCGVESTDTDTDLIKFQLFKHDILSIDYLKIISFKMYNDYELLNHFNLLLIRLIRTSSQMIMMRIRMRMRMRIS